jgi:hypothetical protein
LQRAHISLRESKNDNLFADGSEKIRQIATLFAHVTIDRL